MVESNRRFVMATSGYMNFSHGHISIAKSNLSESEYISPDLSYILTEWYVNKYCLPIICSFGFVGNILNLAVLTSKRGKRNVSNLEKSAHMGLIALAVSDMLYCFLYLPNFLLPELYRNMTILPLHSNKGFWLYREVFIKATAGIFITFSTFLTVIMALGRYITLCSHPFRAQTMLTPRKTAVNIGTGFLLAILFNLHRLFGKKAEALGAKIWYVDLTQFGQTTHYKNFEIVQAIAGIFIPVIILTFCNIKFIRTLKASSKYRQEFRRKSSIICQEEQTSHRKHNLLTLTLVIVILLYIVGVVPHIILNFTTDHIISNETLFPSSVYKKYLSDIIKASAILNVLEAAALSVNFILYCSVNVYFRDELARRFFCCGRYSSTLRRVIRSSSYRTSRLGSVKQTII